MEEGAIGETVRAFRAAPPDATIYVYDNNSTDKTCAVAAAEGAVVRTERMQGKGNVVRRMFADIEADVYVLADGDATYDASVAPKLIDMLLADAARPEGSVSKLSTYRDGWRIPNMIIRLSRIERPIPFFGLIGALLAMVGIILAIPLVITYVQTGLVPRFPTAILATGIVILAFLCFFTGVILDTVERGRLEIRRLAYLAQPAPGEPRARAHHGLRVCVTLHARP